MIHNTHHTICSVYRSFALGFLSTIIHQYSCSFQFDYLLTWLEKWTNEIDGKSNYSKCTEHHTSIIPFFTSNLPVYLRWSLFNSLSHCSVLHLQSGMDNCEQLLSAAKKTNETKRNETCSQRITFTPTLKLCYASRYVKLYKHAAAAASVAFWEMLKYKKWSIIGATSEHFFAWNEYGFEFFII